MVLQTTVPCSTTLRAHKIYRKNYTGGDTQPRPQGFSLKNLREKPWGRGWGIPSLEPLPSQPHHRVPVLTFRLQSEKLTNPAIDFEMSHGTIRR